MIMRQEVRALALCIATWAQQSNNYYSHTHNLIFSVTYGQFMLKAMVPVKQQ